MKSVRLSVAGVCPRRNCGRAVGAQPVSCCLPHLASCTACCSLYSQGPYSCAWESSGAAQHAGPSRPPWRTDVVGAWPRPSSFPAVTGTGAVTGTWMVSGALPLVHTQDCWGFGFLRIYLFERGIDGEKARSSTHWVTPWLASALGPSCAAFPGTRPRVEQLGLELVLLWDSDFTDSGFMSCSTVLALVYLLQKVFLDLFERKVERSRSAVEAVHLSCGVRRLSWKPGERESWDFETQTLRCGVHISSAPDLTTAPNTAAAAGSPSCFSWFTITVIGSGKLDGPRLAAALHPAHSCALLQMQTLRRQ